MWSRVLVRCLLWTATVSSSQIQDSKSHTKASAAVATQYSTYDPHCFAVDAAQLLSDATIQTTQNSSPSDPRR
ncbi:hypothetical protein AB1N83_013407 [Pleurotus pulmonarius]